MVFPQEVLTLISLLEGAGHEAWAVGGCVRDTLLSRTPNDWDLCTDASPAEMKKALAGLRLLETGEKHGTLTAVLNGAPYEITTYRTDGEYENHRRPRQVAYVKEIREDLSRRDFTINAMAAHPRRGVLDLFGGQADLQAGVIRCVGQPRRRFEEDSLRILRGLRFSARFGFEIEPDTLAAMQERASLMLVLSQERIYAELKGLICAPFAHRVLPLCPALLQDVAPGLQCAAAPLLSRVPQEDLALRFALLFSSSAAARKTLMRLRAPKRVLERVCLLLEETDSPRGDRIWMRKALGRLGEEALKQRLEMERARDRLSPGCDEVLSLVLSRRDPYRTAMLALSGADLVLSGVCPRGPVCGRVLETLLNEVMEEKVPNDRDALMQRAKDLAQKIGRI